MPKLINVLDYLDHASICQHTHSELSLEAVVTFLVFDVSGQVADFDTPNQSCVGVNP